jgi:hypothetical protein
MSHICISFSHYSVRSPCLVMLYHHLINNIKKRSNVGVATRRHLLTRCSAVAACASHIINRCCVVNHVATAEPMARRARLQVVRWRCFCRFGNVGALACTCCKRFPVIEGAVTALYQVKVLWVLGQPGQLCLMFAFSST